MVITEDFESSDLGSIPGTTLSINIFEILYFKYDKNTTNAVATNK